MGSARFVKRSIKILIIYKQIFIWNYFCHKAGNYHSPVPGSPRLDIPWPSPSHLRLYHGGSLGRVVVAAWAQVYTSTFIYLLGGNWISNFFSGANPWYRPFRTWTERRRGQCRRRWQGPFAAREMFLHKNEVSLCLIDWLGAKTTAWFPTYSS